MRFSLRTLLILMLLAGPLGAVAWRGWEAYCAHLELARMKEAALRQNVARRSTIVKFRVIQVGPIDADDQTRPLPDDFDQQLTPALSND